MENQTLKLEHVLSVDKGDFVGVSNPYGTLGLCCIGKDVTSRETFLPLRVCLGIRGQQHRLKQLSYSDPMIGKTCLGLSFTSSRSHFQEMHVFWYNYAALVNAKSLYLLDVEKYISKHVQSKELESKSLWYENKENRIVCYVTPSDNNKENMVNIGYIVNNHDLGTVFESVCISQVDGITPVIAFDNEDSAPMDEDDRMSTSC